MNIREYEEGEAKKKEFEGMIEDALSTFLDRKELCCERGWESNSIQRSIIISHMIRTIRLEMNVECMRDNGLQTRKIYRNYIEPAIIFLEDAARELKGIDED